MNLQPDTGRHADPNSGTAQAPAPKGRAVAAGQAAAVGAHLDTLAARGGLASRAELGGAPPTADGLGTAGGMTPHLQSLDAGRMARQCNGGGKVSVGRPPDATQRSRK